MKAVENLSIDLIKANKNQPRTTFDDEKILELSESIKANGLIQPIVVRQVLDHYEIIAGERRFRASMLAGLVEVPVIVKEVDDQTSAQMALVENIQREDLTAIEEARAYHELIDQYGLTQTEIAKQMGKSQSTIANKLRLLRLPEAVKEEVLKRNISERHARELLKIKDEDQLLKTLDQIVEEGLTVKKTEELVKKSLEPKKKKRRPITKGYSQNHRIAVNTIKKAVDMTNNLGIKTTVEEFEEDDEITMIIKFEK